MTRVEQLADGVTLYLGDCREILPSLPTLDAVITDPPYGIGAKMQGGTWGAAEKYADFRRWDVAPSVETLKLLRNSARSVVIWGGNYFEMPPARCWLVWNKLNAVRTMADFELAWTNLDRPAKRFDGPVGVHRSGHPTEKPLALMSWCILQVPASPLLIADPYMGSGTTGVAAIKLGRKFIGIEAEPKYFEISLARVSDALRQPSLFADAPNSTSQQDLGI